MAVLLVFESEISSQDSVLFAAKNAAISAFPTLPDKFLIRTEVRTFFG